MTPASINALQAALVTALSWLQRTGSSTRLAFKHPIFLFRNLKKIDERGMSYCNNQINDLTIDLAIDLAIDPTIDLDMVIYTEPTMAIHIQPVVNLLTVTIDRRRPARQNT